MLPDERPRLYEFYVIAIPVKNHDGVCNVYMMKAKNTDDVDLDYLLKCKGITKNLYNEMQGKNIYEIVIDM